MAEVFRRAERVTMSSTAQSGHSARLSSAIGGQSQGPCPVSGFLVFVCVHVYVCVHMCEGVYM